MDPVDPSLEPWNHPGNDLVASDQDEVMNLCKRCSWHCQLCFLKKGLGISYGRKKQRRRRRSPQSRQDHQNPVPKQPFTHTRGIPTGPEESKKKVASKAERDPCA
ncbi:tat protein [Human immunodeficiency virus 1]|uniref:Protein Tat n=1 Tax=Human immunodeficiency virus type 1 TaxID=11676 RepID=A0A0C5K0H9_HV1|nr:tat protein [Human immunodeficiency virus 1]